MSEDGKFNSKNIDSSETVYDDFSNTELTRRMASNSVGTEGYWAKGKEQNIEDDSLENYDDYNEGKQIHLDQDVFIAANQSLHEILNNIRENDDTSSRVIADDPAPHSTIEVIKSELLSDQYQEKADHAQPLVTSKDLSTEEGGFPGERIVTSDINVDIVQNEEVINVIDTPNSSNSNEDDIVINNNPADNINNESKIEIADNESISVENVVIEDDVLNNSQSDDSIDVNIEEDDIFVEDSNEPPVVENNLAEDTFIDRSGNDVIDGGADNDLILGGEGNDTLSGGEGNDTIQGNEGDDLIDGGDGQDILVGGAGHDTVNGGTGDDDMQGGAGDDHMYGGEGSDTIDAGDGADTVFGGVGDDVIDGGAGDDVIFGDNNQGPVVLENGNYDISSGGGMSISVDSLISTAGTVKLTNEVYKKPIFLNFRQQEVYEQLRPKLI